MDIASNKSLWSLSATNIDGDEVDPLQLLAEGKKCVMIVNVASLWGITDGDYKEMVQLHE